MVRSWMGLRSNRDKTARERAKAERQEMTIAQVSAVAQASTAARERLRAERIVMAVATGALLGALAAMPYDQLLGISAPLAAILRSVLTTAIWAGLRNEQPQDLNFSAAIPQADGRKASTAR